MGLNLKNGHRLRLFMHRGSSAEETSAWKDKWSVLQDAEEILLCDEYTVFFRTKFGIDMLDFRGLNTDKAELRRAFDLDWETCGKVFIGSGCDHIAVLRKDGTAYALGNDLYGQCQIRDRMEWKNTVQISDGLLHTLGLLPDGTVMAHGLGRYGATMVQSWRDVVAVQAGREISYGLLWDGRVITTPRNEILLKVPNEIDFAPSGETWEDLMLPNGTYYKKDCKNDWHVKDWNQKWSDLTALAVGREWTAGLRKDGTVCVTCGPSPIWDRRITDAMDWKNIEEIQTVGKQYLVGREKDGTLRYCPAIPYISLEGWRNIVKFDTVMPISPGDDPEILLGIDTEHVLHAVGNREGLVRQLDGMKYVRDTLSLLDFLFLLRTDGTVVCVPTYNEPSPEMEKAFHAIKEQLHDWKNIRRIVGWWFPGTVLVYGLREDGRVETAAYYENFQACRYLAQLQDRTRTLSGIRQIHVCAGRLIVGDDDGILYYYPEYRWTR